MTVKPIPNFKRAFLAFAKKQTGPYQTFDPASCALGQFVATKGFFGGASVYRTKPTNELKWHEFEKYDVAAYPAPVYNAVLSDVLERTWEALVERLKAL